VGKTVEYSRRRFPTCIASCTGSSTSLTWSVVELALQAHTGTGCDADGYHTATGKRMDAPCCDVFRLVNARSSRSTGYTIGDVMFAQLGVLSNIEKALAR